MMEGISLRRMQVNQTGTVERSRIASDHGRHPDFEKQ